MRTLKLMAGLGMLPMVLAAQQPAVAHLGVLPDAVRDQVIAIVTNATSRGLPGQAIADRAIEAIAKGRSGAEASAAAQALAAELAAAHGALVQGGRAPDASEIESAAAAMELGVDAASVSAMASSAPSGRSLVVPLTVFAALVTRGLPSDDALQAVSDRLTARVSDAELVEMPGEAGLLIAQGYKPSDVGRALSTVGRPSGVPTNGGRPGVQPNRPSHPTGP